MKLAMGIMHKQKICFLVVMVILEFVHAGRKEEKFTMTSINCALNNKEITSASILVSDIEHSKQKDGLNIVVYDLENSLVLHTTSFPNPNTRRFLDFFDSLPPGVLILGTSQILCNKHSATAFDTQRSVLYAMRRLGLNTLGIQPLVFRSAVFAYCKESCHPNVTATIPLPFSKVHAFKQGPILLSFRIQSQIQNEARFDHVSSVSRENGPEEDSHPHTTLYAVIISCSLFICLTVCAVALFIIKRRQNENRTVKFSKRPYQEKAGNITTNVEQCELLYMSKQKSDCYQQQRYEPTTSARLFSMYSDKSETNNGTCASMDGFASYVRVETDDQQLVYKIPSGVSKHDPPSFPPCLTPKSHKIADSSSTLPPSDYLDPHDYEKPGHEHDHVTSGYEGHVSIYQEVDETHEEYMSLEPPYYEDQYNEPIYDSCSVEYHIPNCEI